MTPPRKSLRRRMRRILLPLVIVGAGWTAIATFLQRQALGRQNPAVSPPEAIVHRAGTDEQMSDVRALTNHEMAGRGTGEPGGRAVRAFIEGRFRSFGLSGPGGTGAARIEPFSFTQLSIKGFFLPGRPFRTDYSDAANVLAVIPGSVVGALAIVLSAHYDHLGIRNGETYPGADDNASGIAVMLQAARWFTGHAPMHPILLAAFDAEELGLCGSKEFLTHPPLPLEEIDMDLNLDMVSRSDRNEIFATGTWLHPQFGPLIEAVQAASGVKILLGHDKPIWRGGLVENWTHASDQGSFEDAGIPALYFGVDDHADYHQPTDTADRIDPAFFTRAADAILETLAQLDARLPLQGRPRP